MADVALNRLIDEGVEELTLAVDDASCQKLWQHQTGFLEMFLAYFYECGRHTSGAKSYRDFLFEVLLLHQRFSKPQTDAQEESADTKEVFEAQDKKDAPISSFEENAADASCGEVDIFAQPVEAVCGDGVPEAEIMFASVEPEGDANGNLKVAVHAEEADDAEGLEESDRLLPCLICLKWFPPEARLAHDCVSAGSEPAAPPCCSSRKRFKCRHCDKSFDSSYKLTRHGRSHSGERPFACAHCAKSFSRKEHRSRHLQQVHAEVQPVRNFPCDSCERSFKSAQARMFHERTHAARADDDAVP